MENRLQQGEGKNQSLGDWPFAEGLWPNMDG